jgi:hypothetical protein
VYYPEGTLHAPDEGLYAFNESAIRRLARLYPDATWWPYAVHVTWRGEAQPTAFLTGGMPHDPDGEERARLQRLLTTLRNSPTPTTTLLRGHRSFEEQWDLSLLSSFFERYL